jgi:hypothetical protein
MICSGFDEEGNMASLISQQMPSPRLREIDRVAVAADPERAWQAVRALDFYQLGWVRALFGLRVLAKPPRAMHLDDVVAPGSGFQLLGERPGHEFVAGAVGKFWMPRIPFAHVTPESFARFAEPGSGKVAWSLAADARKGGGAWITVDLRVDATDEIAWRRFRRYWIMIGHFSRLIRRGLLDAIAGRLGRATVDDTRELPGDELLPDARAAVTHTIDIEAPPRAVWPWLIQMGRRRAGWYSWDALDNGGLPSADHVVAELQHLAVGDRLPVKTTGDDGFAVLRLDEERVLALGSPSLLPGAHPWDAPYDLTWTFVLEPIGDDATHLLARVRAAYHPSLRTSLLRPAITLVHDFMERKQLRTLKQRAEHVA